MSVHVPESHPTMCTFSWPGCFDHLIILRCIHVIMWISSSFIFYCSVDFHGMCISQSVYPCTCFGFFFCFLFFFFLLFRAVPPAYRSSQARGRTGAAAASLHHNHNNVRTEPSLQLHHSSRQHQIPDPLNKVRDRTRIFMNTSQIRFHCAMMRAPTHVPADGHLDCSQFGLLQIRLLQIFICKSLCGHMLSFLLGKYLGMECQNHMFNILRNCQAVLQSAYIIFDATNHTWDPVPSHPCQHLVMVSLSNFSHFSKLVVISCCDFNLHV